MDKYNQSSLNELTINPVINAVLELIAKCDELLIKAGISVWQFNGSCCKKEKLKKRK